jgi:hypothetical protein
MATAADVRSLEQECPWLRADFRADLAALSDSTAAAARQLAADARVLARLAAQVPRCDADDRGATPWTSFRSEVAVARSISDRAAAAEIRTAIQLTTTLPRTLALLDAGATTAQRARAFATEVEVYDDAVAQALDAQLAQRVAGLPVWRIVQEVRRVAATLDPEAAALRTGAKNHGRGVLLQPDRDDQATVIAYGPAVPLTRWYESLTDRARALKQAGDPRTLDQLRFDLLTSTYPCAVHPPALAAALDTPGAPPPGDASGAGAATAAAGLRPSMVEPASVDCRMSRPVRASITVPVETSLGLSNEPGWLDGYGWLSAPTCRLLLVDAELRRVCVQSGSGQLVDVADRDVRPPPTPAALRHALVDMVLQGITPGEVASRAEDQHDPSPPLRAFVQLRDRFSDGPTGARVAARRADLDHDRPYPDGPTAAWNLVARAQRTHQLKHHGWTPLRTPTSTIWFSPAGQVIEMPLHRQPPPGIDSASDGGPGQLPDPDLLARVDQQQLVPPDEDLFRPSLPDAQRAPAAEWTWCTGSDEPPF